MVIVSSDDAAMSGRSGRTTGPTGSDASDEGWDGLAECSYTDAVVRMGIGRMADNIGWNAIGSLSLDILTEVAVKYIQALGKNCMRFANMSGRTQVTLPDVGLAFNQLHLNLTGLQEYISSVQPHPIPCRVCRVPAAVRPSNRIKFASQQRTDAPFGEDIEIGYAVTDSDDEDQDEAGDSEDQEKDYLNCDTSGQQKGDSGRSHRSRRVFRRSDYYEDWMPAFPEPEKIAAVAAVTATSDQQSSLKEETSDSQHEQAIGSGLKVSELEPSSHLSYIHLNSAGQIIAMNGVTPVEPDKSFPDDSGPESLFESEDEAASGQRDDSPVKAIDKLTIKNTSSGHKMRRKGEAGSKKLKGLPISLSIKVSGLRAGTPTASPKLSSGEPLPPDIEERMDSTIDDVIAAAGRAVHSPLQRPGKKTASNKSASKREQALAAKASSAKKKEKEYSSREFVESDDDSNEEEAEVESKEVLSPALSHVPSPPGRRQQSPAHGTRKEDKKVSETIDSVIKSVMSKTSPPAASPSRSSPTGSRKSHMTPERTASVPSTAGKVVTKAAAKHFPDDCKPINKIESEAAEILMAFSTKPVETPAATACSGRSSPTFSPFNLGKALAAGAFTQSASFPAAPLHDMIGQPSDIHPFAPNPPPTLPFKTLAMKKAFDEPLPASRSPASESEDEKKRPDDEEEEKRRKKEKKKKKKESRDKDKKKKDRKKEKAVDEKSESNIPKLSIKIPSKSAMEEPAVRQPIVAAAAAGKAVKETKVKKEEAKSKVAGGCILISETIKQTSSASAADAKAKGKAVKKEKEANKKPETKCKAKDKGADDEEEKIWICPACKQPDDGSPMIGCDNCEEWYHWTCVGIKADPEEDSWFCPRCTDKQRKIEQGLSRSVKKEKRKFDDMRSGGEEEDDGKKKKRKKKKPG